MIPLHDDNPTELAPLLTVGLIITCVLVFLWQNSLGEEAGVQAIYSFGFIPAVLFDHVALPEALAKVPTTATLFTSMFMHGGWMHLGGNLLYLWIFGNNIEDRLGHGRFMLFYLLCGLAAALAQALPDTTSQIPMVGASGAISGILGAYLLLYPKARVLVLIPLGIIFYTLRLPALAVLGFWFVLQLISSLAAEPGQGGVAFGAHIGGFVAGMALLPLFLLTTRRGLRR
ncbi:MAG: rhomboid family intramembrane serine protease [Gammaproteobacteria bacterium]|nr:MAG: rhomboid family intramembrane serine protease [Gammaproteobacteria bacterium]